jgi:hypothetical protein
VIIPILDYSLVLLILWNPTKWGLSFGLIEISPRRGGYDEPFDMGYFTGNSITYSFLDVIENLYQRIFYLAIY